MGSDLWLCEAEGGEGCVCSLPEVENIGDPDKTVEICEAGVGLDP